MKYVIGGETGENKMKHSSVDLLRNNAYSQFLVSLESTEKLNIERKHLVPWSREAKLARVNKYTHTRDESKHVYVLDHMFATER